MDVIQRGPHLKVLNITQRWMVDSLSHSSTGISKSDAP